MTATLKLPAIAFSSTNQHLIIFILCELLLAACTEFCLNHTSKEV
jgi:hypothetical protein